VTDPFRSPQGDPGTQFVAAFDGDCDECGVRLFEGDIMYAQRRGYLCERCWEEASGIDLQ
jgi:hypothetical protein